MADNAPRVAGVRFRNAGKIFYFHASGMRLEVGEYVIVESVRGPEVAKIVISPDQVVVNEMGGREELKPILRLATGADLERADELRRQADELLPEARALARDASFPGRIDAADFTLDGRRLTFSFSSEDRVDYRDFVRRTADRFHAKVDMRQLGSRDRAKLAGGYGICGRELCCSSWLTTFPAISIRMAKEQDLPLNPQKISGLCGRLLCCLSYEEEGYREMRKTLPKVGHRCSTPTGEGKVIAVNILRRQVTLWVDGQRIEVSDRDLGTVVRWDPSSKAAEPPPSMSRTEAIEQGLIEADEIDLAAEAGGDIEPDWITAEPGPGRGRLPGGGPRKIVPARGPRPSQRPQSRAEPARGGGPQPEGAGVPEDRGRGRRPRGRAGRADDAQDQRDTRREPSSDLPQGRTFQRSQPPISNDRPPRPESEPRTDATPSPDGDGEGGAGRRRRRGRGGRGPRPEAGAPAPE